MRLAAASFALCVAGCGRFGFGDARGGDAATTTDDVVVDVPVGELVTTPIKPSVTGPTDVFGYAVALSADGTTLAVGAYGEASNAVGVGGDPTNNDANLSGAVYIYTSTQRGIWTQQAYLKASNTGALDVFGYALAISADGNTLVVGAPDEDSAAITVDGDGADNTKPSAGAAYVFTRTGTTWAQDAYLKAPNSDQGDNFGEAVAITGDGTTVAIGAWSEDGVGGTVPDPSSNAVVDSGAVYTFMRVGAAWSPLRYLKASNAEANDHFGIEVVLSRDGTRMAISATAEASGAIGVGGNQLDNSQIQSGAVYVLVNSGSAWLQEAYVKASNTDGGDFFGYSIALSADGSMLAASSEGEDGASIGVGAAQLEGAGEAGAVYVFGRTGTTWAQAEYIKATNTGADDRFGRSVAVSSDGAALLAGAALEDGANDAATDSGAAYLYGRSGTAWSAQRYLKAPIITAGDQLGNSVALAGDGAKLALGAYRQGSGEGAVYVIE
jgi:hypothetical protein